MKRFTFQTLGLACLLVFLYGFASAQQEENKITIKANKGKAFQVFLKASADNSTITLVGGVDSENNTTLTVDTQSSEAITVKLDDNSDEIIFKGNLVYFDIWGTPQEKEGFISIDASENKVLKVLACNGCSFQTVNISKNEELELIDLNKTKIKELAFPENSKLTDIAVSHTEVEVLDVSKCADLGSLECQNTKIKELDLSKNTNLSTLYLQGSMISKIDVSHNKELTELYCSNTPIETLDVSKNTKLTLLVCHNTKISELDISALTELTALHIHHTQISSIDVSKNANLLNMSCYNTLLSEDALDKLYCDLPARTETEPGNIYLLHAEHGNEEEAILKKTAGANLASSNWQYSKTDDDTSPWPLEWTASDIESSFFTGQHNCADAKILIAFNPDLLTKLEIIAGEQKLTKSSFVQKDTKIEIKPKQGYLLKSLTINGEKKTDFTFTAETENAIYSIGGVVIELEEKGTPVESRQLAAVRIAPNPCGALLHIYEAQDIRRYALVNALGGVALSGAHDGSNALTLNTAQLPAGVYLLRIEAADGLRTLKVVKE